MGVKYFLVCVRNHKSNLSTNICTTVRKKTQWSVEKRELLSETTFLPYFMMAWCVFFTKVFFFTNGVYHVFHHNMFLWFFVKKYTPCQGMIWFSLTKVVSFTLAFVWELNYTIKAWLSLKKTWKNGSRALPSNSRWGLRAPDPANPSSEKMTSQPTFFCCMHSPKV